MNITIDLSISQKNLKCENILNSLKSLGISSKIISQKTLICKKKVCYYENGCDITFTDTMNFNLEKVWNNLKTDHKLNCGYLNIHGVYRGCILNYLRQSNCPKN